MSYVLEMPLVFVDTETTSLEPAPFPWEIALIKRGGEVGEDTLHVVVADPDLSGASAESLRISRFYDRHPLWVGSGGVSGAALMPARDAAAAIEMFTAGTQLVGCNPDFDAGALEILLRTHGLRPRWHHQCINLVPWTYGVLGERGQEVRLSTSSYALSRLVGVDSPGDAEAHTAMGDARWVRRWWDALSGEAR